MYLNRVLLTCMGGHHRARVRPESSRSCLPAITKVLERQHAFRRPVRRPVVRVMEPMVALWAAA